MHHRGQHHGSLLSVKPLYIEILTTRMLITLPTVLRAIWALYHPVYCRPCLSSAWPAAHGRWITGEASWISQAGYAWHGGGVIRYVQCLNFLTNLLTLILSSLSTKKNRAAGNKKMEPTSRLLIPVAKTIK